MIANWHRGMIRDQLNLLPVSYWTEVEASVKRQLVCVAFFCSTFIAAGMWLVHRGMAC